MSLSLSLPQREASREANHSKRITMPRPQGKRVVAANCHRRRQRRQPMKPKQPNKCQNKPMKPKQPNKCQMKLKQPKAAANNKQKEEIEKAKDKQ